MKHLRLFSAALIAALLLSGCGQQFHTVTFDLNGGELVSGSISQQVPDGSNAIAPEVSMEGYTLSWDGSCIDITEDCVITAVWQRTELTSQELIKRTSACTVKIRTQTFDGKTLEGYGFITSAEGCIITLSSLLKYGRDITVTFPDGSEYSAEYVLSDEDAGIAEITTGIPCREYLCVSGGGEASVYCPRDPEGAGLPYLDIYADVSGINTENGEMLRIAGLSGKMLTAEEYREQSLKKLEEYYSSLPCEFYPGTALKTYSAVTGEALSISYDSSSGSYTGSYDENLDYFVYPYADSAFAEYTAYLINRGFSLYSESETDSSLRQSYYNPQSGVFFRFTVMDGSILAVNVVMV